MGLTHADARGINVSGSGDYESLRRIRQAETLDFGLPDGGTTTTYGVENMTTSALPTGDTSVVGNAVPEVSSTSAGIGAGISVITSILGVIGTSKDIDRANEVLMKNMGNQFTSFLQATSTMAQGLADLNRALGDKLSANGMDRLKKEARVIAGSAETGGSGTATTEATQSAGVNQLHADAAAVRSHEVAVSNKLSEIVATRLGFENTIDSIRSGQQSPLSAALQTYQSGMSGLNMGLAFMTDAQKEEFFGTNTTGVA